MRRGGDNSADKIQSRSISCLPIFINFTSGLSVDPQIPCHRGPGNVHKSEREGGMTGINTVGLCLTKWLPE